MTTPRPSDLLAAGYDVDGIRPGSSPARSIVVCSPPGVAGRHVADVLRWWAGVPLEYFDLDAVAAPLARRWRVINLDDYIAALHHHRSSENGVFGLMLRWQQLRRLHRQVTGLKQITAERMLMIATTIAPNPTFLLLRTAELQDALVAHEASEGMTAADDSPAITEPRAVTERRALTDATEQTWLQWFAMSGVRPLQVEVRPDGELAVPTNDLIEALHLSAPTGRGVRASAARRRAGIAPGATAAGEPSAAEAGPLQSVSSDLDTGRTAEL
jgi:hypothetical protein